MQRATDHRSSVNRINSVKRDFYFEKQNFLTEADHFFPLSRGSKIYLRHTYTHQNSTTNADYIKKCNSDCIKCIWQWNSQKCIDDLFLSFLQLHEKTMLGFIFSTFCLHKKMLFHYIMCKQAMQSYVVDKKIPEYNFKIQKLFVNSLCFLTIKKSCILD